MEQRIREFEQVWASRIPPIPVLERYEYVEPPFFPPPPLQRQTNSHELLPQPMRERWWNAETAVDRDAIMMEYEAMEWEPAFAWV
jgi:hypothetical protein